MGDRVATGFVGGSGDRVKLLSKLPEAGWEDKVGVGDEVRGEETEWKETGWTRKTESK